MASVRCLAAFFVALSLAACGSGAAPSAPAPVADSFQIHGDPESPAGATWTFRGVVDGTGGGVRRE